jgi:hypothetical protein
VAVSDGYADEVLADSPYAYYRLNDASGSPADSSGNSRPATAVAGTPVYNTTGGPAGGGYMTFDGSTEYVTLGNMDDYLLATNTDEWSMTFWMRTSSNADMAIAATLNDGTKTALQAHINRNSSDSGESDGAVGTFMRDESNNRSSFATNPATLDIGDGSWHHVGIAYDANAGFALRTVVIDGSDMTLSVGNSGAPSNFASFQYDLLLGARNLRGTVDRYFDGDLAEVAFFPNILSVARIQAQFNAA